MKKKFWVLAAVLVALVGLLALGAGAETAGPPAICPHCNKAVTWTALDANAVRNLTELSDGHYYPAMDADKSDAVVREIKGNVCFWLNGKTLAGTTRGLIIKNGATLNIMGEGTITGRGRTGGLDGGCAYIEKGGTLNLYSGTLSYVRYQQRRAHNGGVVYCEGTFNMYGGSVLNGKAEPVDPTVYCNGGNVFIADGGLFNMEGGTLAGGYSSNAGGNIYCSPKGAFKMSGGSISGGTTGNIGTSVLVRGTMELSGDACIDVLQLKDRIDLGGPALADMLTVKGAFTGDVKLFLDSFAAGLDIGNSDRTDLSEGSIAVGGSMLSVVVSGDDLVLSAQKRCEHCREIVEWKPLTAADADGNELASGHYYLDFAGDSCEFDEKFVFLGQQICLDLNGKEFYGRTRAFSVYPGGELNIMGDGTLKGRGSDAKSGHGGALHISADSTVNLYGGVLTHTDVADDNCSAVNGGVVYAAGNLNIYDGLITGGTATNAGGSAFVESTGSVKMYGGSIENGTATAAAPGVYCKGSFLLSGDAAVAYLYLKPVAGGPALADMVIVSGEYTGRALLVGASAEGRVFGISQNADFSGANVTFSGKSALRPAVWGDHLVAVADKAVMAVNGDTFVASYDDLATAVTANAGTDNTLVLLKNATGTTRVTGDITLDLNGHNVEKVEVSKNATLYCLDTCTDDFDISDGIYGRILNATGDVQGAAATEVRDNYLMASEQNVLSFHRIKLNVRAMSLRPSSVGLYFKCEFDGDSKVKDTITGYGVALSLVGEPTAETMGKSTLYTVFDKDAFGTDDGATSCLVDKIMKPGNAEATNQANSGMQIYGTAYVSVGEGKYIFGHTQNRSLQEQLAGLNENLSRMNTAQKASMHTMYQAYSSIMGNWNLTTLEADIAMKQKSDAIEKTATQVDVSALESVYAGTNIYFGELHDHAATGGTSDGKQPLSVWKHYMEELDIDFATIVDHRQTLHMRLDEWDNTMFVGGSEPATTIKDREGVKLHYNMIVSNPEALEKVLYQFPEFDFRIWTEEDRAGCGGQMHFAYPSFTGARFTELCNAIYENGGFVSIVHPKSSGYITSEDPVDAWFRDGMGIEVFYTYNGSRDSETVKKNYALWTGMLAAGKKVYATAGNDEHNMPSVKGLSAFYTSGKHADIFVESLRSGNFAPGVVGIRMSVGDTAMGGTTDFTGKRLVFSVGDFHSSVADPTHTYRVDLISNEGVVFSQEITGTETTYFAIDAQEVDFYRVEVHDVTANSWLAIGNPIWNE